ncbi:DUF6005 family protein [Kumtagia ephedrae]|uniref:Phosphopantetheine-binding protein n=1 Tax=Kumtagia ephedrae TaxID=2116701 RepID=A0A2P7SJG7_9HYPH|nr:DUF6005 family protein [Mesorhizobium ephedrae]PSJ62636.1 phosphopantetheine-binding protein [Mesorhizobium ephedrae]
MTKDQVIEAIRSVLRDQLNHAHLDRFGPGARLNEDLYLDSVLILEIFLALELQFGLSAPEEAINRQDIATVAELAGLFTGDAIVAVAPAKAEPAGEGVHGEDYIDIKVHCFVSSVCDALKRSGIDQRPFYFGVWDADFAITERWALAYHHGSVDHQFFRSWYERLYGVRMQEWYDRARSKDENVAVMLDLIERRRDGQHLMVMLDLFHLPERENKFNQNPFPHYLMLEKTDDPMVWQVNDPDFRWEGRIERDKILDAIRQPTVAGGFLFDRHEARPPADADLRDYFLACHQPHANPLVAAVRRIVRAHLDGRDGVTLADLATALRELPVISIRKYAYEHGFAFFWRSLKLANADFDFWCDEIERLIQEFKAVHYAAMRLAQTGDRDLAADLFRRLDTLDGIESRIKARLGEVFRDWCAARGLAPENPVPMLGAAE